ALLHSLPSLSHSLLYLCPPLYLFFFFTPPATTAIYPLSLHDALPILGRLLCDLRSRRCVGDRGREPSARIRPVGDRGLRRISERDRKSTRLNSSHRTISYAVFCLKKKKKK